MLKMSGKIFKLIRESKKMSLKEVAADVISTAQLSRFERGISGITIDSFYSCLKNMAVSLDEFQYVYHNYTEASDLIFSSRLSEACIENNPIKLRGMLDECQKLEEEFPKKKIHRLNTIVVKAVLSYCDSDFQIGKKDIDFLTDYLFSVEEWGRYELWLFTQCVDLLTLSTLETFASEMINRTQFYNKLPANRRRIIQMLFNVISVAIEEDQLQVAMKFLNYIDNSKIPETDLYERILVKYYQAFYAYRIGNRQAMEDMEQCLETLEFLDCYGLAQKLKLQIDKMKEDAAA